MVKILMHGCNGKMGRMITEIVKNEEDAVIAAGVDKFTGTFLPQLHLWQIRFLNMQYV